MRHLAMRVAACLVCSLRLCDALLPSRLTWASRPPAAVTALRHAATASRGGVNMRFVVRDVFKVKLGNEDNFEDFWRERQLSLEGTSGFVTYMMMRGEDDFDETEGGGRVARDGYATYEATTVWMHRMDFDDWRSAGDSPDKKRGHCALPQDKVEQYLLEPPAQRVFETIVTLPRPAEENGGLFEWEENPDYFDGDME